MKVQFYSKPNCALCEDGYLMLKLVQEDFPFEVEVINIEEDDAIHEEYMLMIPVVKYGNEIIQWGRLDYPTLLEALAH